MSYQDRPIDAEIIEDIPHPRGGALAPTAPPIELSLREMAEQAYLAMPPDSQTRHNWLKLKQDADRGDYAALLKKIEIIERQGGVQVFAPQTHTTTHNTTQFIVVDRSDRSVHNHYEDNRKVELQQKEQDPDLWMPAAVCIAAILAIIYGS